MLGCRRSGTEGTIAINTHVSTYSGCDANNIPMRTTLRPLLMYCQPVKRAKFFPTNCPIIIFTFTRKSPNKLLPKMSQLLLLLFRFAGQAKGEQSWHQASWQSGQTLQ